MSSCSPHPPDTSLHREEQDLNAGAVLQAEVQAGEGDASPAAGDLVYVHVTVRTEDDDIVYSTRSEHGGNGQALAFVLEKGKRAPRGWEIVLKGRDGNRRQQGLLAA